MKPSRTSAARAAKYKAGSRTVTIACDLAGLDSLLAELGDKVNEAVRPAAQAAAQVLYDDVKRNVGKMKKGTGNLASSIYQVYSKDNSNESRATYHIGWNHKKAPHGNLVEFGHLVRYEITFDPRTKRFTTHKDRPLPTPKMVAAHPFIRPAMAKFPAAIEAAKAELLRRIEQA